jgi:hypothetical protein
MTILRAHQRKQLQEGLNSVVGLTYKRWDTQWTDIFTEESSNKAYEEDVMHTGLGAANEKGEGAAITYDDMFETYVSRYHHATIVKAVSISEEAVEDNLYLSMGAEISKAMTLSTLYSKELRRANILNYAFDSNFPGGDDVQLLSTAHPLGGGGVLSNTLATPAQLSEAALEQLTIQIADWDDERGLPVKAKIKRAILPTALQYVATRIFASPYQVDTQSNNVNALKHLNVVPGFSINVYLSDPAKWFLITDVEKGLRAFKRVGLKKGLEGAFETGTLRYKLRERYSQGWSNWRGIAGS